MKFTINTRRYKKGAFTKRASVTTNDAQHHKESLTCTGSILVPIELSPSRVNFGQIEPTAEPQRKTVRITRGDGGPLVLELLPSKHENVKAALREIKPGEEYELDIDIVPPWPQRVLSTDLTLKTGVSQAPDEKIRVYARMAPRLSVEGQRFKIPRNLSADLDLRMRLKWSGDKPGKALEATSSDPELSASIEEKDGGQYVVLHVPAGYKPPANKRPNVTVKTDDPLAETLRVPIYATRPIARLRAMPTRYTIPGSIASELDLTVRLLWSDNTPGKVTDATSSDPGMSVRVDEQGGQQLVVLHVPAGYTMPRGTRPSVTVTTDDKQAPTLRIPIYAPRPVARLRALPARFTVPPDSAVEQDLKALLVWSQNKVGKVLEATSSDPQTSVRIEEQDGKQFVVLHVPPGYAPPASPRPVVTVKTDDPKTPTLNIHVFAGKSRSTMRNAPPRKSVPTTGQPPVSGKTQPPAKPEP